MVRIRNGIGGAVALAASLLVAVAPALGQDHGGFHGGGGGHFPVTASAAMPTTQCRQHWAGMHPNWGGGPRVGGGAWVRPWGPRWVPHYWGGGYWHGGLLAARLPGLGLPVVPGCAARGLRDLLVGRCAVLLLAGVYYAWSPDYDSYVVTDPPPVTGGVEEGAAAPPPAGQPGADSRPLLRGRGAMSLFVYPKNGQSEQQTANDRYQCHEWAVSQTGYDPTNSANSSQAATATPENYKRAMTACLDARGYSVQ